MSDMRKGIDYLTTKEGHYCAYCHKAGREWGSFYLSTVYEHVRREHRATEPARGERR
jgi:hypothetical protein